MPDTPSPPRGRLSTAHFLLLAAAGLERECSAPWRATALVVRAWRLEPERFGLDGFRREHPDSHRVASLLSGPKGLVARGWLRPFGRGMYEVAPAGWEEYYRMGDAAA